MKKILLIIISCLLALSLLGAGAFLLYHKHLAKQTAQTEPTTESTTPTEAMPFSQLSMTLNGEQDIYLEYGETYTELGATAILVGENTEQSTPVEITGQVDATKIGSYVVTYSASAEGFTATAIRNVHIVDTQLPTITLVVDPEAYTIPGQDYKEEGFRAMDNYDGDITDKVTRAEENGIVTYTVTDSSGNTFTTQRTIHYFDPGKPDLKLVGADTYLIAQGDEFTDPGFSAIDKNDGDITSSVLVQGELNTDIPGRYTLEYTATNSYDFSSSVTRTIIVLPMEYLLEKTNEELEETDKKTGEETGKTTEPTYPPNCIISQGGMPYEENGKTIYLTFDDGPSKYTEKLLDILAKYDVKVSFFVRSSSYLEIIRRASQEGHTIAVHTYSHNYKTIYTSEEAFYADMSKIRILIDKYTDYITPLFRFPGGSSNTISKQYNKGIMTRLAEGLTKMGYTYFDWNVDSNDAGGAKTPEEVFNNITKGLRWYDDAVVLQHDTKEYSVDAVERVITWALVNGYSFAPLTEDSPTSHHPINN